MIRERVSGLSHVNNNLLLQTSLFGLKQKKNDYFEPKLKIYGCKLGSIPPFQDPRVLDYMNQTFNQNLNL